MEMPPGPAQSQRRSPPGKGSPTAGNFCGRIKGVKYRFALKDGTWDFPGDTGPGHLFEGHPVSEGTTRRGTDTPVHRPETPRFPHRAPRGD